MVDAGGIGDGDGITERAGGIDNGPGVSIAAMAGLLAVEWNSNVSSIHEFFF
jgi:hypothetical protein